jgi:uncharacterized repeat protein (TIGR01451 family)
VLLVLAAAAVGLATLGVGTARAWHADGVTVTATCDKHSDSYLITATIQQSQDWPGAFVKSITPSSVDGYTKGDQTVVVVIGWTTSAETQTFTETVSLDGNCGESNDATGTLTVVKHVVNDDGGEASAGDWTMNVSGPTSLSFAGAEDPGTSSTVDAGDYTVTESGGPSGYTLSYSGDCDSSGNVTVPAFHSRTCVLTNDDVAPETPTGTLIVIKHVVNDSGGNASADDWTMNVSGPTSLSFAGAEDPGTTNTVDAGDYTVAESGGPSGYALSYSGDCDATGHVTVPPFHTRTCVLTNDDIVQPQEKGSISVSKSADPTTLKEPGGPVTFSVRVTNTSDVDVVITNVVDDKFGDLDDEGGNGCFDVPFKLAPGASTSCQFTEQVTGSGGTTHVDTVTASGTDENGNSVSASDDARVDITSRLIDLVVTKQATSPTKLHGTVHYALTVTNKGPDTATNVQLADPAPAGITYLTATTSQGTCTVTASLITCDLGTLAPGQTVTIEVTGRSDTVGSHTNTATVTGSGGTEANPADNTASAVTVTPAPVTPPTPKPKPKPHPKPCLALNVTPKMIKADGKQDHVVVKVTAGGKAVVGAKVVVRGVGIRKSGRTGSNGTVVIVVNPGKTGLITVSTPETRHSCGARRIGVAGVFLPPVTG